MNRDLYKAAAVVTGLLFSSGALAADCVESVDQMVSLIENGTPYQAQVITHHTALIASRDLTNSKGVRLEALGAIIQQDRTNLHKSGMADHDGDFQDGIDKYFTTLKRRTQLSSAKYYMDCFMSAGQAKALKADIVNGRVLGVVWVVSFQRPDGGFGVYLSQVN